MSDLVDLMLNYCKRCSRRHGVLECEAYCVSCGHCEPHDKDLGCVYMRTSKGSKDIVTTTTCDCKEFVRWEPSNVASPN